MSTKEQRGKQNAKKIIHSSQIHNSKFELGSR